MINKPLKKLKKIQKNQKPNPKLYHQYSFATQFLCGMEWTFSNTRTYFVLYKISTKTLGTNTCF